MVSAIEVLDLLGSAGVAELADGLVLDLADTLTGNAEDLAHFLQGVGAAVVHAEAHTQNVSFPLGAELTTNMPQPTTKCVSERLVVYFTVVCQINSIPVLS